MSEHMTLELNREQCQLLIAIFRYTDLKNLGNLHFEDHETDESDWEWLLDNFYELDASFRDFLTNSK